jgi:mono/diheme cytochrome c family protein
MKHPPMSQALIASILAVTANSWGQTSVALGRADYKTHCASCHGPQGKGDGVAPSFPVNPRVDLTTIAQRNGGTFPDDWVWDVIDGRWSGDCGAPSQRSMPAWGQLFNAQAMDQPGDSPRTAEWVTHSRIESLIKYLHAIQVP